MNKFLGDGKKQKNRPGADKDATVPQVTSNLSDIDRSEDKTDEEDDSDDDDNGELIFLTSPPDGNLFNRDVFFRLYTLAWASMSYG